MGRRWARDTQTTTVITTLNVRKGDRKARIKAGRWLEDARPLSHWSCIQAVDPRCLLGFLHSYLAWDIPAESYTWHGLKATKPMKWPRSQDQRRFEVAGSSSSQPNPHILNAGISSVYSSSHVRPRPRIHSYHSHNDHEPN